MSRGGPICPEAGQYVPRRAYISRGGHACPEVSLSVPRRAYLSQAEPVSRRAYMSRGGPIYPEPALFICPEAVLSARADFLQILSRSVVAHQFGEPHQILLPGYEPRDSFTPQG